MAQSKLNFVPKAVLEEINAIKKGETRYVWSEAEVKEATDMCQIYGRRGASREWKKKHPQKHVATSSLTRWHAYYQKFNKYFVPEHRGAAFILPKAFEEEVLAAFTATRNQGEEVQAPLVCACARGIMKKHLLGLTLAKEGGKYVFSDNWGRCFLLRHHASVFGATTTRCNSAEDIVNASSKYYTEIRSVGSSLENTYNMDEFFCLLRGSTRRWTWHFKRDRACVPIRDQRLGFTSSVLTAASGQMLLLQMIWKGKTDRSEAEPEKLHPRIMQQHREKTHFQNAKTFEVWFQNFVEIADMRRRDLTEPVCLILDAAHQHVFDGMDDICLEHNIHIVQVPPGLTHAFQPADQYVIAGLKAKSRAAWNEYVEELYSRFPVDSVIAMLYSSSAKIVRSKKYDFMAFAIDELGEYLLIDMYCSKTAMVPPEYVSSDSDEEDGEVVIVDAAGVAVDQAAAATHGRLAVPQPVRPREEDDVAPVATRGPRLEVEQDFELIARIGRPPAGSEPLTNAELRQKHATKMAHVKQSQKFFGKKAKPLSLVD